MPTPISTAQRMTVGIMLSLVLWGIYLAIGATGVFVQSSMMDVRKSGIVMFCVALFLGLWGLVIRGALRNRPRFTESGRMEIAAAKPIAQSWNASGVISFTLAGLGIACWAVAIVTWKSVAPSTTTILGWFSALLVMGSTTAGIVALSDQSIRRGKWLGMIGLVTCIASLIAFVARMTP